MHNVKDVQLKVTRALPNGAAAVNSTGIDLGLGSRGDFLAEMELVISAPAMTTSQMPDAKTMKYDVQCADDAAFSVNLTTLALTVITQTGAGGAGCAAQTLGYRLPVDVRRFVRVVATGSAAGDATAAIATIELAA